MKTVIITGANGNLGSAVTKTFLAKDYKVIATVRKEEDRKELADHPNLQVEVVDLTDEAKTESFVRKAIEERASIDGAL
ncbi:MAG: SDR family NAD(P)-dependent oxidoreductase, partial [Flavisolibacter sp.]